MSYQHPPARIRPQPPAPRVDVLPAILIISVVIGVLWLIEAYDVATGGSLNDVGIVPREAGSLPEIFVAPLLHHGWGHLISNTIPLACLGALILLSGVPRWFNVTMIAVIFSGLAVWLFSPTGTVTAGASGVVFGYLTYLLARGFFTRNPVHLIVGVGLFLVVGGMLLGVLPGADGVSWQGHLGGAVGGLLAAKLLDSNPRTP